MAQTREQLIAAVGSDLERIWPVREREVDGGFVHVEKNPTARWNEHYLGKLSKQGVRKDTRIAYASSFIEYLDTLADEGLRRDRPAFVRLRNNAVRLKELG